MSERRVGALLFAGGKSKGDLAEAAGTDIKALADINGRPMVAYVWQALQEAETIGPIVLVSEASVRDALGAGEELWRPSGPDVVENILTGAETLSEHADLMLVTTCDIPLVTGPAYDRFVRACLDADVALCYAFLGKESCTGPFADVQKTWIRFREGHFAGGNVVLATRDVLIEKQDRIREAFALRKSPLGLARRLGVFFALGLILGRYCPFRVSVGAAEKRVVTLLGVTGRAIPLADAELGIDVDNAEDLEFVRGLLADRERESE